VRHLPPQEATALGQIAWQTEQPVVEEAAAARNNPTRGPALQRSPAEEVAGGTPRSADGTEAAAA
jgi:hypothetical protein